MKNRCLLFLLVISCFFVSCTKSEVKNIREAKLSKEKSIVVINNTDSKYVTECKLTTEKGLPIDISPRNIDSKTITFLNFDKEKAFKDESSLRVEFTDRHGLKYEKIFTVNEECVTEVEIVNSDRVHQKGDLFKILEKAIN